MISHIDADGVFLETNVIVCAIGFVTSVDPQLFPAYCLTDELYQN